MMQSLAPEGFPYEIGHLVLNKHCNRSSVEAAELGCLLHRIEQRIRLIFRKIVRMLDGEA